MSSFTASLTLFTIYCTFRCSADVQFGTNGDPWMCNNDPENRQRITPLSPSDQKRIKKLEQVQIIHRHGARTGTKRLSSFLPNADLEYNCNITTIETREYKEHNYYKNASKPMVSIRKQYVEDQEIIEGNCKKGQSLQYVIPQHQANAHHIKDAYIGNEAYHLMNDSIFNDIRNNLMLYSQDERVRLTSTDFERTIASLTVLISELWFENTQQTQDVVINTDIHDYAHDPFDKTSACTNEYEYQQWDAMFTSDPLTIPDDISDTQFAQDTIAAFTAEGGVWSSPLTGLELLYPYCAGMNLPLTNDTFYNAVKLSYDIDTAYVNTSYAKEQTECYYNFMNIPMLYSMFDNMNNMKQSSLPGLVIYSVHDSTLIHLLKSLGMYDYELIIFAELITLEIYSAANASDVYYFRFTRKGEFVPYPSCDYRNGDTELCDLNVMINRSFTNVVPYNEWLDQCSMLMTNCECGYCEQDDDDISTTMQYTTGERNGVAVKCPNGKTSDDSVDATSSSFWIGIVVGLVIGVLLTILGLGIARKLSCNCFGIETFVHSQYVLEEETYKL